ncbi:iron chaperone [Flavihumibacter stibioxidans]|uniref:YdhG-like domain-containing protein n=1 Tax=Flavihumibacter stibioxidans TaxID=1834163 RepID=A0ABR7M5S2_9BACT|nr:DUF1801 domain-containing protein [Flavihumibacter stibioxidans]MBC6490370.1 hypothetical protein [Flavihumibacter stibioxidans]
MSLKKFFSVGEYLSSLTDQQLLVAEQVRQAISQAVPEAEETISYNMPAYKFKGVLVYFAAWKNHLGYYPLPSGIEAFRDQLKEYEVSKGAIQFPYSHPLPLQLIADIARFRLEENRSKKK